jgi:hypothetical protein
MPSSTSSSDLAPARPKALGLALLTIALVETWVWHSESVARFVLRHQPKTASGDAMTVSARIELIDTAASPLLVLLGSSQVREGLDCNALVKATVEKACANLGIGGGSPLDMLYISRALGRVPGRTVVISLFPGILHKAPKSGFIDTATAGAIVRSGSWRQMDADDWRLLGLGQLQSLSPTLRRRDGLRDGFAEMRRDGGVAFNEDRSAQVSRTTAADRQRPIYFANRLGRIDPDFTLSRFSAAQERGLDLLIEREVSLGHSAWIVDFPTRPGFETTVMPEVKDHYARLLGRLRARPDIRLIDAEALGPLSEERFIDFTHLDSEGRQLVSERLARILVESRKKESIPKD